MPHLCRLPARCAAPPGEGTNLATGVPRVASELDSTITAAASPGPPQQAPPARSGGACCGF
eukprot:8854672-Alexandrium_andersonii.AAC.1